MKFILVLAIVLGTALAAPKDAPGSRIIGGKEATANSRPYIGYLTFFKYSDGTSWHCGGTLLSQNYVLTAASCALSSNLVEVILGVHDIYKAESTQLITQATDILLHPDYNNDTYANDIALVKLPQTISYSDAIQPAALPTSSDASNSYEGVTAYVSGWGLTSTGKISEVLLEVAVQVISNTECEASLSNINENELCTSGKDGSLPCSQDFGGPLITDDTSTVIGIASHTDGTCQAGSPAVYTKVGSYLSWIQDNSDVTA